MFQYGNHSDTIQPGDFNFAGEGHSSEKQYSDILEMFTYVGGNPQDEVKATWDMSTSSSVLYRQDSPSKTTSASTTPPPDLSRTNTLFTETSLMSDTPTPEISRTNTLFTETGSMCDKPTPPSQDTPDTLDHADHTETASKKHLWYKASLWDIQPRVIIKQEQQEEAVHRRALQLPVFGMAWCSCGQLFNGKYASTNLNRHIRESKTTPQQKIRCRVELCGSKFTRGTNLHSHYANFHMGIACGHCGKYQCKGCGTSFTSKDDYNEHIENCPRLRGLDVGYW